MKEFPLGQTQIESEKMARTSAMKSRIDLAFPVDFSNMESIGKCATAMETLKSEAEKIGFTLMKDVKTDAGSFDFGGDDAGEENQSSDGDG